MARKVTSGQNAGRVCEKVKDKKVHAVDGTPSTATVAAVEDIEEINEAGIFGDWSDDEDDGVDTSEAWVLMCGGQQQSSGC